LFAPCEKVFIDQTSNTASIIGIVEEVKIQVIAGAPVAVGLVIPMQWAVLSLWEQASAWEMDRSFEQRLSLLADDGSLLVETVNEFRFTKPRNRLVTNIIGMPTNNPGMRTLKVAIREKTDSPKEWREIANYSFSLTLSSASPPVTH
jgi:hypothetical protein